MSVPSGLHATPSPPPPSCPTNVVSRRDRDPALASTTNTSLLRVRSQLSSWLLTNAIKEPSGDQTAPLSSNGPFALLSEVRSSSFFVSTSNSEIRLRASPGRYVGPSRLN